jgi:hypothetical protein
MLKNFTSGVLASFSDCGVSAALFIPTALVVMAEFSATC